MWVSVNHLQDGRNRTGLMRRNPSLAGGTASCSESLDPVPLEDVDIKRPAMSFSVTVRPSGQHVSRTN